MPQSHSQAQADQELFLQATRLIACPVVCLAVYEDKDNQEEEAHKLRAMISTVHYAQLSPLVLGTSLSKKSTTGNAILSSGLFSVNLMAEAHCHLLQERKEPREFPFHSWSTYQVPGLDQALAKFACELISQTALDDYVAILARVLAVEINEPSNLAQATLQPIIRYNRSYNNLNFSTTLKNLDQYPV